MINMKNISISKNKIYPVISFFGAIAILVVILGFHHVIGYGNLTIAVGDLIQQYIAFIQSFIRVLRGQESFWYSFSNYLGSGSILTYAYYTLNPFNLLYLIPGISITAITTVIILIKFGLIASCFNIFEIKTLKFTSSYSIIFSFCYALSSYAVTMHFNIMWLDVLYILPILVLLIVDYVNSSKFILLIAIYAYMFITNFYMGYIAGIFTGVIFVGYLIYKTERFDKIHVKKIISKCLGFGGIVLVAIGLCAAIMLPTVLFLYSHLAMDNSYFENLVCSIPDIINSMFIGQMMTIDNQIPQLYAGIIALVLLPFYFINKSIDKKERIIVGIIGVMLLVACVFLPLYKFMHAFDYPNYYGFRFAFCFVFLILFIAIRQYQNRYAESTKAYFIYGIILTIMYSLLIPIQKLVYPGVRTNSQELLLINAIFVFLWIAILCNRRVKVNSKRIIAISFIVITIELSVNGYICMEKYNSSRVSEKEFYEWFYAEQDAINTIKASDSGMYRVEVDNGICLNAASMFGYGSFTTFSSSDDYNLRRALSHLGMTVGNRFIENFGQTEVFDMLMAGKYYIFHADTEMVTDDRVSKDNYIPAELYYNENCLNIGYMVSSDILNYEAGRDPFANQENLIMCMTGKDYDFYETIPDKEIERDMANLEMIKVDDNVMYYTLTTMGKGSRVRFNLLSEDERDAFCCFYMDIPGSFGNSPYMFADNIGQKENMYSSFGCINKFITEDGSRYVLLYNDGSSDEFYYNDEFFYYYNADVIEDCYTDLSAGNMELILKESDLIAGKVNGTTDRNVLFTSIPYDDSWNVYVDDQLADKLKLVDDAFIGVEIPEGEHIVVFQYNAAGKNIGMIITLISGMIYAILILYVVLRRRKTVEK